MASRATRGARKGEWSFRIVHIAGIELRVHVSFLLIVVLFALGSSGPQGLGIASGMLWLGIIFTCVTAHEMAHSLMARRHGIGVRSIMLLPIGGVSRLERMPEDPRDECAIAIVGPLTSIAIALAFAGAAVLSHTPLLPVDIYSGALMPRIAWFNLVIAGFNLLPAFPMDGGRVLRALLERRMDRVAATATAARIGRAFAGAMIVAGFLWNVWLAFVGVFIFLGAAAEEAVTVAHAKLKGILVREVMLLDPIVADADRDAGEFSEILRVSAQDEFPVVRGRMYAGIVSAEALAAGGAGHVVGELADADAPALRPDEPLEQAFDVLVSSGHGALAVLDAAGVVVGLLRSENVRSALAHRHLPGEAAAG